MHKERSERLGLPTLKEKRERGDLIAVNSDEVNETQ